MKKILLSFVLIFLLPSFAYPANKWMNLSTSFIDGDAVLFNDIDTNVNNYVLEPLNRLLTNSRAGMVLTYSSASALTVTSGSVVCNNSALTINDIRINPSSTSVSFSDIDTGSEASSTTYYVYANCDANATTATFKISTSGTAPSGVTYYKRIGSFLNDGSSNITTIDNDGIINELNTWSSKTIGSTYQALTDGQVCAAVTTAGSGTSSYLTGYTDSSSSPTTVLGYASAIENSQADHSTTRNSFCMPVKTGDFYKVTTATWAGGSSGTNTMYFLSTD